MSGTSVSNWIDLSVSVWTFWNLQPIYSFVACLDRGSWHTPKLWNIYSWVLSSQFSWSFGTFIQWSHCGWEPWKHLLLNCWTWCITTSAGAFWLPIAASTTKSRWTWCKLPSCEEYGNANLSTGSAAWLEVSTNQSSVVSATFGKYASYKCFLGAPGFLRSGYQWS